MGRELFGTDGVRAIAGEYPLDDKGLVAIGRAVGSQFATEGEQIFMACDTRQSSSHLVTMLAQGLQEVGVKVVSGGVMPTPGLAYITAHHDEFVAAVMITASHNPYEYNGVKVFSASGSKLPDEAEARLNYDIVAGVPDRDKGSFENRNLVSEYEDFLVHSAGNTRLDGMKIVVDTANGAASGLGQRVFERLGANVVPIGNTPDGRNINVDCGATHTDKLQEVVRSTQSHLGIAVDGDADRLMMIDDNGDECNGDHLMYLLAVGKGYHHVVATVMTNLGAEQALAAQGISVERTAVGDRYVLERLIETGYRIGGEQSGHIIMTDLSTTGDGLLSAVQVLAVLDASHKTLAQWRSEVVLLPQALVNFRIEDKTRLSSPEIVAYIEDEAAKLGKTGRILVRPSGTEPLARVMVEAPDAEHIAQTIAKHLQELIV